MAKTTKKAGKRATAAGRSGLRARKSSVDKTRIAKLRKLKPARPGPRKGKPSLPPESASLKRQLKAARMQQQASAEILRAVANASGDVARPLQQIAETTARLFGAPSVSIQLAEGGEFTQEYRVGGIAQRIGSAYPRSNIRVGGRNLPGTVVFENRQIHIPDLDHLDPSMSDFPGLPHARAGGARTVCGTPLRREGKAIGVLIIFRNRLLPFTEDELALQQSFADQAVIAIENARLFEEVQARTRDLTESLQQQTATADVLKVISRSAFDLDSVMNTLAHSAGELCKTEISALYLREGDVLVARGVAHADAAQAGFLRATPLEANSSTYIGRTLLAGFIRNVADVWNETEIGHLKQFSVALGFRSILFVPLTREGRGIGVFALARQRTGQFSHREIELIQTFADQAVIAIENARLFDEVQARTRDLSESLQQQTATADVLQVISNSVADTAPVFDKILEGCGRLFNGTDMMVFLVDNEILRIGAVRGPDPDRNERIRGAFPLPITGTATELAIRERRLVTFGDVLNDPGVPDALRQIAARVGGNHSVAIAPMLWEDRAIGTIFVSRTEPMRAFDAAEQRLLQTFADQAVIAIQNARMFNETQEALERQTATADILKVIASSPDDVQPVFDAIASSARRLIGGFSTAVHLVIDDMVHLVAFTPTNPESDAILVAAHPRHRSEVAAVALMEHGEIVQIADSETADAHTRQLGRARGWRGLTLTPLMNQGNFIGFIASTRRETGVLGNHHVELLRTFADQAVIAIENARLFDEVQARTKELAASLDDLRTAQDRLVQTEKLASLGQLTAGIAHEIKNPLNFINNFSALSAELVDEMTEVFENPALDEASRRKELDEIRELLKSNLEKVVQHGERADSIVKNMLLHSREGSGEQRPADINALLDESLNLAYHGARAEKPGFNITLQRNFDPSAGDIELFPQEITRAFLNLISNGFYAASKRKAENGEADFEPVLSAATKNLGNQVEIRIRDNGTGIPPEMKDKIFNPFFTTKPTGEGTGLGLSMSHDIIVKQHGGRIEVDTQPGQFTEFTVILPRTTNLVNNRKN